jgi:hypothetical protein
LPFMKLAAAKRFVRLSLLALVPILVGSLLRFVSLGDKGFLDISEWLVLSSLLLILAEGIGLLGSLVLKRINRHARSLPIFRR